MQNGNNTSARDHGGRRLPYRAGLDGLRALAVAGVFLYHANVAWMPGGFLGVDLFFVLSGYLITSLLLQEHSARGVVDLVAFWGRRARRLLPAVAVVIVFALVATLTIARDDLGRTRSDALSALVYLTNWHEILASHSYFDQFGRPSLLQNLWSLAVEEQFYLFWPLLLIGGLRRWGRRGLLALTVALATASFALMWLLYSPAGDPSRVYYGTDTRAFTLLIGALLAFAWPAARDTAAVRRLRPAVRRLSPAVLDAAGLAALLGVLAMFVRVQDFDPWLYRGGYLVMAILGAVVVASVAEPGSRLGRLLGAGPLRWVGVRSYGIYLWHWPVMQLTRPRLDVPLQGAPLIVAQALVTLAVAALSYRYVETPVRSGDAQRRLKVFLDRHTPHQRLAWVSGAGAALVVFGGLGFGLPAPVASAEPGATSTAAARQSLRPLHGTQPLASAVGSTGSDPGQSQRSDPQRPAPPRPGAAAARPPRRRVSRSKKLGGGMLAAGDSVMLGCAPNLEQVLGPRLRVDAVVGRQAEATIGRLAQYRAAGELPNEVIVQIGDNGAVWYADMQHLRNVLRGVQHVVIVNVRLARSWQNEVNSELKSYVRTWPQAVLANWYTHSSQAMLVDGVHPSVAARAVYARLVASALRRSLRRRA